MATVEERSCAAHRCYSGREEWRECANNRNDAGACFAFVLHEWPRLKNEVAQLTDVAQGEKNGESLQLIETMRVRALRAALELICGLRAH